MSTGACKQVPPENNRRFFDVAPSRSQVRPNASFDAPSARSHQLSGAEEAVANNSRSPYLGVDEATRRQIPH